MIIYVDANAVKQGNGTKKTPFRRIQDAAKIARPGDEVHVFPGTYREYVNPAHAGLEEARITYKSVEPLGAHITGAEIVKGWQKVDDTVWMVRVKNSLFEGDNPYTKFVYGDWYFAKADKHCGCVYLNDHALYEVSSLEECKEAKPSEYSWVPEESVYKWYTCQDEERDETILYANFQEKDPNVENVEINVRRYVFFPSENGIDYITVSGFVISKAATNWAPPAAFQEGMIGPNWSKGWIIEECDISNSKCAGISLGKYYDPENNHFFTYQYVKSPTQMERDAVCRGQFHGWLKEKIGSHIIRKNHIHHCEQGGIIGRMGGVFSIIEDNHIEHINNMMELGGAEISAIKMHAAIDVTIRRNHIHHSTMGIWCDWEAQGTRITGNLLHDNRKPDFAKPLPGGMMSQDIFVEVSHGPTLIDHNILLSEVSMRFATQGVAMVHNLICGSFSCVGEGTTWRYTPYHMPHRTEVMGFMTILHGDDRFYNNIFVQKWSSSQKEIPHDSDEGSDLENREVGTGVFNSYPNYEEWISQFDFTKPANMALLEPVHFGHLPVWTEGNLYLSGAKASSKELNGKCVSDEVKVEIVEKEGRYYLDTNLYDFLGEFTCRMIHSDILGKAFEPQQRFENPDETAIYFNEDYFGAHRGVNVIPGPFSEPRNGLTEVSEW